MTTAAPALSETPRVSVVITVRDGEKYLDAAIRSICEQTFRSFELIVINDGSRDGTAALLDRHAAEDPRVRVFHRPPRGFAPALNEGCDLARAPLIARMDADDVSFPDRFERQVAFLDTHPEVSVLGSGYIRISPSGEQLGYSPRPTAHTDIVSALERHCVMAHPTVMMRSAAFREVGGYRAALRHTEDYDLWLRLSERMEMANLPDPVLYYRVHSGQMSSSNVIQTAISDLASVTSAHIRRTQGYDPVSGDEPVTREFLLQLGVTAATIDAAIAARFVRAGVLLSRGGHPRESLAALHEGNALLGGHPILRDALRIAYREAAHRDFGERRLMHGAANTVRALAADPRGAMVAIARRFSPGRPAGPAGAGPA